MLTALPLEAVLGLISGGLVGLTLGLVGGGGSVLAVPLLVYFVGVPNPHVAIGSSAAAVAVNALMSLANHTRATHDQMALRVGLCAFRDRRRIRRIELSARS